MRNNGDGTFGARVDYGVGFYPFRITFGDIDSDGDIDIGIGGFSILRNNGDRIILRVDNYHGLRVSFVLVDTLVGYSGNYVSGVITENTVWTRSNSPYIVSGHIGVDAEVSGDVRIGYVVSDLEGDSVR